MLDRLNVSVSVATMLAIMAKIAILFEDDRAAWIEGRFTPLALYCIAMAFFLVFFRGKMMHDDSSFFSDIEQGKFKTDTNAQRRAKFGLILGYISWLLWAPAIYFLEHPEILATFMFMSIFLSTVWLVIDILTRSTLDPKRAWWIISNLLYLAGFGLIIYGMNPAYVALLLIVLLFIDWSATDPIGRHLDRT